MLCKAIDSVLNQSYDNVEIIVVDDNNPDTIWRDETVQKMSIYDANPRVTYICHECNKNGSAARNTGIMHARGEYFCFLDDDDVYFPEKIRKQVEFIRDNNIDACFCDYKKNGRIVFTDENIDIVRNILLEQPTPQTSGWMMTRKVIQSLDGFDESYYRHQDYEFLLRFFRAGFKIKKIDEVLYERLVTEIDNNPSGIKTEKIKEKLFADFSDFVDYYCENERGFKKKLYVSSYASSFKNYFKSRDFLNCTRLFLKSCLCSITQTVQIYLKVILSHI